MKSPSYASPNFFRMYGAGRGAIKFLGCMLMVTRSLSSRRQTCTKCCQRL